MTFILSCSSVISPTWVSATRVLGSLVRAILTVKLSVTLPLLLVEATSVGTAELIWTTCRVFYTRTRVCLSSSSTKIIMIHVLSQLISRSLFKNHTKTHHILGIHLNRRSSRCHGRTQSAWGYTVCSGTWTHSPNHKCCWCTLEMEKNTLRLMDIKLCWSVSGEFYYVSHNTKQTDFPLGYYVAVPLTAASLDTLISSIRTVLVSITLPALRHTHVGAGTLESLRTAGLGFCGNITVK